VSSSPDSQRSEHSALRNAVRLTLFGILFWLLLAGPAWWIANQAGLIGLTTAAGLCLMPGYLAVTVRSWAGESQSTFMLAAGGIRLAFVLTGVLVVKFQWPDVGISEFHVWLIAFYLFTLAFETRLVVHEQDSSE
jgi:hypothetical protein